ncbi:MAG: DNA repair protein RecO [Hyphomonadaceae bacterium]|nr:DNA repair protein RecO [Hyphomonadaceae bacterium]MBC6411837.1 DNA repair protein RecO [Hyphomonadaceae bacterium]
MNWSGEGHILSVKKHGETSAIIDVFTRDQGRHAGLVRGGAGRKMRPVLQPGNLVGVEWRGRLSEHLGYYVVEPVQTLASGLMEDQLSLAGLNAACAMARETLPEREAYPRVFEAFGVLLANMHDRNIWPALYVRWEAGLLSAMGYGLDLATCVATGDTHNLTHVSPRSGRAVSARAAAPYVDKLLKLPNFMYPDSRGNDLEISQEDVLNGLRLTGYFLETRVQWGTNRTLPEARARMVEKFTASVR